jgi:hypothetical protein
MNLSWRYGDSKCRCLDPGRSNGLFKEECCRSLKGLCVRKVFVGRRGASPGGLGLREQP